MNTQPEARDKENTHCTQCARELSQFAPKAGIGGTGYAIHNDAGERICYNCANANERAEMTRAAVYVAYLSGDGSKIATWPGGELARVFRESESRTGWQGSKITHIRARAFDGSLWYGKGAGRGMVMRIRRAKVTPVGWTRAEAR